MIRLARRSAAAVALTLSLMAPVLGAAALVTEAPLAEIAVVPDGWTLTSSEVVATGIGLDVLVDTTGPVVSEWVQATHVTLLRDPADRSAFVYAHRFDTPEHAREVWLGVLRLAEEPDVALPPRVLADAPDVLLYGAASAADGGSLDSILVEEAHRVVGRDVVILVMTQPDVAETLPSPSMQALIAAHRAAFPQDQFDLPAPGHQGLGTSTLILLAVLALGGAVIIVSAVVLVRRRQAA